MKILNKSLSALGLFFAIYFLWIAYISIFQASANLRDPLVNEADKKSAFSMKPSLPTEFLEDGSLFWWITSEGMSLEFSNNLNERVVGDLNLFLSGNPCEQPEVLLFNAGPFGSQRITVLDEQVISLSVEIDVEPYENFKVDIKPGNIQKCTVGGGDSREFTARLNGWIFE